MKKIIRAIVKNLKAIDSYTIYFFDDTNLTLYPKKGKVTCDCGDGVSFNDAELEVAANSDDLLVTKYEKLMNFYDLPFEVQKYVIRKLNNSRTQKNNG